MLYIRFESNKAKSHCVVAAFTFIIVIVFGGHIFAHSPHLIQLFLLIVGCSNIRFS